MDKATGIYISSSASREDDSDEEDDQPTPRPSNPSNPNEKSIAPPKVVDRPTPRPANTGRKLKAQQEADDQPTRGPNNEPSFAPTNTNKRTAPRPETGPEQQEAVSGAADQAADQEDDDAVDHASVAPTDASAAGDTLINTTRTRQWMELARPEHASPFEVGVMNNLAFLAELMAKVAQGQRILVNNT